MLWPLLTYAETNQQIFLSAIANLRQGKTQQFLIQAHMLRHYPLYPYLVYQDIILHLPQASASTISSFIETYQQTPLANDLREQWLKQLFQRQQWQAYLHFYQPTANSNNSNLQCQYHWALWQTQQTTLALQNFMPLLTNHTPISCLQLLSSALRQGKLPEKLIWQQIALAFARNNLAMAVTYAKLLPSSDKKQFLLWQHIYQEPPLIASPLVWQQLNKNHNAIVAITFSKLANHQVPLAITMLQKVYYRPHFSIADQQVAIRAIGMALAEAHDPQADHWLTLIQSKYTTDEVLLWRIRTSLYQQHWSKVLAQIKQLSLAQQKQPTWRYWRARALAATGNILAAHLIYHQLALKGDFYGQLASVQIHQSPSFALQQFTINHAQTQDLAKLPALQRAHELYQIRWLTAAHQEWLWALHHMSRNDDLAAAELAIQWGWYNQAIVTVNHISDLADLNLRYPVAYRQEILMAAAKAQLNPAWVFALIRQESLFAADIRSSAGALGLMQILPSTGALLARQLQINFMPQDLLLPNFNLSLGTFYLTRLLQHFHHHLLLATAAYNAGPERVQHWLPSKQLPADIWIETIPWHQTRHYVKNIMASTTFYEKKLGLPCSLAQRLMPIKDNDDA